MSTVAGFDSIVNSAFFDMLKFFFIARISRTSSSVGTQVGVPPPMNTESTV